MVINMRYAKIENGIVSNVVVADESFAEEHGLLICPDDIGPGDLYDGVEFSKTTVEDIPLEITPTKEELLLQLQALTDKINALE